MPRTSKQNYETFEKGYFVSLRKIMSSLSISEIDISKLWVIIHIHFVKGMNEQKRPFSVRIDKNL